MEVLTSNDRMSANTIFSLYLRNQYVTDHLSEEGLTELKEIEVPFSIIRSLLVILAISYFIHFNGYFYIFGLLARVFLRMFHTWTTFQDVIFYWYFILHFNYDIKDKDRLPDSAQSRD